MTVEYVPALGTQFMMMWRASKHKFKGTSLSWWKDSDLIKHKYLLASAYYGLDFFSRKGIHFREFMEIPDNITVMGDSGGFQELTMNAQLNPLEVLRWQERNVDLIMNLDYPILNSPFEECLKNSVRNFELFEKEKQTNKPMYNIIHGSNFKEVKQWYDNVKHFSFEYIAIGFKPPNTKKLVEIFLYLQKLNAFEQFKGIHFFGTSSLSTIPIIHWIDRNIFKSKKFITYDSSSYSNTLGLRDYVIPGLRTQSINFGKKWDGITILPCNCPICSKHDVNDFNSFDSSGQLLISLHNLNEYIRYDRICKSLIGNENELLKYVKNVSTVAYNNLLYGINELKGRNYKQAKLW